MLNIFRPFISQQKRGRLIDILVEEEKSGSPIDKRVRFESLVKKEDQFNRELLINVLTTSTAIVHLSYGGQLFILNGLGFLALLAARHALPKRESYQKYPRDGLFGYTALTVGAYFLKYGFLGFERIAGLSIKLVEMGLMYTLWDEREAAKNGQLVFVVDEPDLEVIQAEFNSLSDGLAAS